VPADNFVEATITRETGGVWAFPPKMSSRKGEYPGE